MLDDCLGVGVMGESGRGSAQEFNIQNELVLINSSFGKALGGGSGGYSAGSKEVIELLRQKGRPYVFSNSIAPVMVGAALQALKIVQTDQSSLQKLRQNIAQLRNDLIKAGILMKQGHRQCPIFVIPLNSSKLVKQFELQFFQRGIWVVGDQKSKTIRFNVLSTHSVTSLEKVAKASEEIMNLVN